MGGQIPEGGRERDSSHEKRRQQKGSKRREEEREGGRERKGGEGVRGKTSQNLLMLVQRRHQETQCHRLELNNTAATKS